MNQLRKIISTQDVDALQITEYEREIIDSIDADEDIKNYLLEKYNTDIAALFTDLSYTDAYDATLDKLIEPIAFINSPHELLGTFSNDFNDIKGEFDFIKDDYDFEDAFYNTDELPFKDIERAFNEEMVFAKQVLSDFLRSRIYPRVDEHALKLLRKNRQKIFDECQNVEMRVYHVDGKDRLYFVHAVDWDRLIDILEKYTEGHWLH